MHTIEIIVNITMTQNKIILFFIDTPALNIKSKINFIKKIIFYKYIVIIITMENKNIELNLKEKKEFFASFASLYEAGVPAGDVFNSIIHSSKNEKIINICKIVLKRINEGKTIDEALSAFHSSIGFAYAALIAAGEESGKLDSILSNICNNITKQQELRANLITALIYPVSMFFFALLVGMIFMFIVLPSLRSITDYDTSICTSSLFLTGIIKIITVFVLIAAVLFYIIKNKKLSNLIKNFFSSLWIIRGILKNYYFTNFFYIMYLSYEAGISASKSITLANSVIGIEEVHKKIKQAEKMIENGATVSRALNLTGVFSEYAISQVMAGEESGKSDKMYKLIAKDYEIQTDTALQSMLKMIGPVILFVVGMIVAVIAAKGYSAYYKALFSMCAI